MEVFIPSYVLHGQFGEFYLATYLFFVGFMLFFMFPLLTVPLSSLLVVCGDEQHWPSPDRPAEGCGVKLTLLIGLWALMAHL